MSGRYRANEVQYAERVNAAVELLQGGASPAQGARVLAERFGVSARQARRYVDQAAVSGCRPVPEESVVFTVKLPSGVAVQVRTRAAESGSTISALVARALAEFLAAEQAGHRRG
jgi:predicted DNA-binding transcriptional regulator YafY